MGGNYSMSDEREEKTYPGLENLIITWMRDDVAEQIGLDTEKKRKQFFADQEALAQQEASRWLSESVLRVAGKPIDEIPEGPYCYTNHFSDESIARLEEYEKAHPEDSGGLFVLWIELHTEIDCPYWGFTDHGTYRCNFLEEEGVGNGGDDYEKALSYFGSEEAIEEKCQGDGMLLWDQVRCCTKVVDAIRKGS
jgi:hypothetical protein